MTKRVEGQTMDEERALYALTDGEVVKCTFAGPADGESCLKEARNVKCTDCQFDLRYPLWHVETAKIENCSFSSTCRAACWYDKDLTFDGCKMFGIKIIRECDRTTVNNSEIQSPEFGWYCRGLHLKNTKLESEYAFLGSKDVTMDGVTMSGKYTIQYTENVVVKNSNFATKDAFWHSKNCTVYDSVLKGEYIAWYSENLKLVRCHIIGTQPFCYCKGLVLEDCTMEGTDLSFEYSEVNATIKGDIISIKNPDHGKIQIDTIGELIIDENKHADADCEIICSDIKKRSP